MVHGWGRRAAHGLSLWLALSCGGVVEKPGPGVDGTNAGASSGPPSGTAGAAGVPLDLTLGAAGTAGTGGENAHAPLVPPVELTPAGFPRCGPLDPERADDCVGLDLIYPSGPDVSIFADGSIEVGETGPAFVWVHNEDEIEHEDVCVGVVVNHPGVLIYGSREFAPDVGWTYDMSHYPRHISRLVVGDVVIVDAGEFAVWDVEPGTTVTFTFWTTYVGSNCTGPTVSIDALVRANPYEDW